MTRLAIISLVALAACHEPTNRVTLGGGSYTPGDGVGNSDITIITGTDGDDFLVGTPGPDVINGGAGDDVICGGPCDPALLDRLKGYQR